MRFKDFFCGLALLACLALPPSLAAWGAEGHRIIGRAAFALLDPVARDRVMAILAIDSPADAAPALDAACNWPDAVRESAEWSWTAPLHYVNLPRGIRDYDRERDCRDGLCVTEGVLRYAAALSLPQPDAAERWRALGFLCHLVADLHQPLHAGFRDDRGANRVEVEFRGERLNLHEFWDHALVEANLADEDAQVGRLADAGRIEANGPWNPEEARRWTEHSHALAIDAAYPAGRVIDEAFAAAGWPIVERQWTLASARLARILNAVLGEGAVEVPAGSGHDSVEPEKID